MKKHIFVLGFIFFFILISINLVRAHNGAHIGCFLNSFPLFHTSPWTDPECGVNFIQGCDIRNSFNMPAGSHNFPIGIDVCSNGITVDCNGASIVGDGNNCVVSHYEGFRIDGINSVTIQNCKSTLHGSGIKIGNSNFITLINNDFSDNDACYGPLPGQVFGAGIRFSDATNYLTIMNNNLSSNARYGIESDQPFYIATRNSLIKNNIINSNGYAGTRLNSEYNTIEDNNLNFNGFQGGLYILNYNLTTSNIIRKNTIKYNMGPGIQTIANTLISENIIDLNGANGISSSGVANNNTISNNTIRSNNASGIFIQTGNSLITENNIGYNNQIGIFIFGQNNTISNNIVRENNQTGILIYGLLNKIFNNNITLNNESGIIISGSDNNFTKNNISFNKGYGVEILSSFNDKFIENFVSFNNISGFVLGNISSGYITPSENNTILNNKILNNTNYGIEIKFGNNNNIISNIIENNFLGGLLSTPQLMFGSLESPLNNKIILNNISKNSYGIIINSSNTTLIEKNNIINNNINGISLENSHYNTIANNTIKENKLNGIKISLSKHNNILANNITSNQDGILLNSTANSTIINNFIYSNSKSGIITTNTIPINIQFENTIKENVILNNTNGINLNEILNTTIKNNYICLNKVDIVNQTFSQSQLNGIDNTCATVINWTDRTMVLNLSLCTFMCQCWDTDNNNNPDNDGDALCDNWEDLGIDANNDTSIDFALPSLGFNKNYKDMFIEIDYMKSPAHSHKPIPDGLNRVRQAFSNSPVQNPNGTKGINLHLFVDENIPEIANINFLELGSPHFDDIKLGNLTKNCGGYFGTPAERNSNNCENILEARRWSTRYNLFSHEYDNDTSSGVAELPGNDFMVSLGNFTANIGNQDEQEGTLMHEFGHTLNLQHGGGDEINCKPNYLSIMSYSLQLSDLDPNRTLDYSNQTLPTLNESSLNENLGIQGPSNRRVIFGNHTTGNLFLPLPSASGSVDWNGNGTIDPLATIGGVNPDPNYIIVAGSSCAIPIPGQVLNGFNDWNNIVYNFRLSSDFADGVRITPPEEPELSPRNITFPYSLTLEGSPNITATINFTISDPTYSGFPYIFAFSFGTTPGIPLPTGQTIPLNYDLAMEVSLLYPNAIGLFNSTGNLDYNGEATVTWTIPNAPISGLQLYAGAATLTPDLQNIVTIFNPVNFTIQAAPSNAPMIGQVILNSTFGTNSTNENLTAHIINPQNTVTEITDWRINSQGFTALNMPFDTQSQINAKDYSINNLNGTINNSLWTSNGKVGGAYFFDGINDFIEIPEHTALNITQDITIEAWINWSGEANSTDDIQNIVSNGYFRRALRVTEPDHFAGGNQILSFFNIGGTDIDLYSTTQLVPNNWYHIVTTYNRSEIKIYINGISDTVVPASGQIHTTDVSTFIGTEETDYFFSGKIDEVKIYNRPLSAKQVYENYLAGLQGKHPLHISSKETKINETWQVAVTPSNIQTDGQTVLSNTLIIQP